MEAKDKMIKARIGLMRKNPFFSYIALALNLIEKNDMPMKTMGVDAKGNCYYDKEFVEKLDIEEVMGTITHECLHVAFLSLTRLGNRDKMLWNVSSDITINNMLLQNGFELPKCGLLPKDNELKLLSVTLKDIDKKTAEQIYDELDLKLTNKQKEGLKDGEGFDVHIHSKQSDGDGDKDKASKGSGNGTLFGEMIEGLSEKEMKELQDKWKRLLVEASTMAKQRGVLPLGMERFVEGLLEEKLNWKQLLYKFITNALPHDFTYSRPNRRMATTGYYMPSIVREEVDVVVAIDTSGSISQENLKEFLSEIVSLSKSFNNLKITFIVADCEVQEVLECQNGNRDKIMELKMKGGGGTSHLPVYDYIRENKPNAKILVAFTDGYSEFPQTEEVKTIWVLNKEGVEDKAIPFGTILRLD